MDELDIIKTKVAAFKVGEFNRGNDWTGGPGEDMEWLISEIEQLRKGIEELRAELAIAQININGLTLSHKNELSAERELRVKAEYELEFEKGRKDVYIAAQKVEFAPDIADDQIAKIKKLTQYSPSPELLDRLKRYEGALNDIEDYLDRDVTCSTDRPIATIKGVISKALRPEEGG